MILLALLATLAITVGGGWPNASTSTATAPLHALLPDGGRLDAPSGDAPRDGLGEADGAVPDDTTAFDDAVPGVAKLDPDLRAALRRAAGAAADDGVTVFVDSGWRSRAYQEHLLQQAVEKYGSREEAARWVATPDASAHVSGDAVDVGRSDAAAWLSDHGAAYGLCRIYDNEPWHYELRPEAASSGCPARYADAAHDPRRNDG